MQERMISCSDALVSRGMKVMSRLCPADAAKPAAADQAAGVPRITSVPGGPAQEIKVMSFNVWINQTGPDGLNVRRGGVAQTILNEMPDSFGLQEANEAWRWTIQEATRGIYAAACKKGRYWGMQEGTPIFYRADKYRLLDEAVFWLSETPRKTSTGWDASMPRVAGYAVLQDKQTGFTYVHYNTHFDHIGLVAMEQSAHLMIDRIKAVNLPVVLTGDLNCWPDSAPMQYLAAHGLTDLREAAAETDQGGTFHGYGRHTPGIIDYIWANRFLRSAAQYKVIRDKYNGRYPSDHFAVCADLILGSA